MKRQALKTILFALPKVLDLTARRFPAYRDRLKERNLVAWIEPWIKASVAPSSSGMAAFGRAPASIRDPTCAWPSGCRHRAEVPFPSPTRRNRPRRQELQGGHRGRGRTVGLAHANPEHDAHRRPAYGHAHARRHPTLRHLHQWRLFVYVKDGRIVRVTPIELDDTDAPSWVIEARGRRFSPPRRGLCAPRVDAQVAGLLRQAHPSPDETGRLRPRRRAQSPEPRQVRLCTYQLGRSAGHRRQGDQPAEARSRSRFHHFPDVVPPPVGQRGLLPQRADALRQPDRLHPGRRESG